MSMNFTDGWRDSTDFVISWVVPCGNPQKTASTDDQSASSTDVSGGSATKPRCGNTSAIGLPAWLFAGSAGISRFGGGGATRAEAAAGETGGAWTADLIFS